MKCVQQGLGPTTSSEEEPERKRHREVYTEAAADATTESDPELKQDKWQIRTDAVVA